MQSNSITLRAFKRNVLALEFVLYKLKQLWFGWSMVMRLNKNQLIELVFAQF